MNDDSLKKYLNKRVVLRVASVDNVYYYEGVVISYNSFCLTINDRKEGNIDIPLDRIISIKISNEDIEDDNK